MTVIANTITTTTVKNVRLKLNEVIEFVNDIDAKYSTNTYVNLLLANTNAYIAEVAAASSPSSESFDYGFITSSVDIDTKRDYGTL
jgi:hypothetical protein